MRHARLGLLTALAALSIAGCDSSSDDEGSDAGINPPTDTGINPPTSDIYFAADVDALDDVTVEVTASLRSTYGPRGLLGDVVPFAKDNVLTACVGTACTPLTWSIGGGNYVATLPYVAETAYTISLSRQIDVSAPNNSVTLPVPFTILAPAAGSQFTEGQAITLQWSPAGIHPTRTGITGRAACEHSSGERTSRGIDLGPFANFGLGTADINMAYLMSVRPTPTPRDPNVVRCDVTFAVSMSRTGVVESIFRTGSNFYSHIERSVMIVYTPAQR